MTRRKRAALCALLLLGLSAAAAFAFRRPILLALGEFLVVSDPLEKADAIAILSGHSTSRGHKAAELYHQGWAPRILISKDIYPYRVEELRRFGIRELEGHEATIAVLAYLNVPVSSVEVLDGYNESTLDEAKKYSKYMRDHNLSRLTVVTCSFHARRARMLFRHAFKASNVAVSVQPAPADFEYNPENWWTRRLDSKTLLWEYEKLVFSALRYW